MHVRLHSVQEKVSREHSRRADIDTSLRHAARAQASRGTLVRYASMNSASRPRIDRILRLAGALLDRRRVSIAIIDTTAYGCVIGMQELSMQLHETGVVAR